MIWSEEGTPHGQALFASAKALLAMNRDRAMGYSLAKQALGVFGKSPNVFKKKLAQVNAWLVKHKQLGSVTKL